MLFCWYAGSREMTGFVAGLPPATGALPRLPGAMADEDDEDLQGAPSEAERRDGESPATEGI